MRKILLILTLLVSTVAYSQLPPNYLNIRSRYNLIAGKFDSTLHIPKGAVNSLRTGGATSAGALFYNTVDSSVYVWTGNTWTKPATTASVVSFGKNATKDSVILTLSDGSRYAAKDSTGSFGWGLTGNAGTTAGANFIGTTDNVDFVIKRNGVEMGKYTSTGFTLQQNLPFRRINGNANNDNYQGLSIGISAAAGVDNIDGLFTFGDYAGYGAIDAPYSNFFGISAGNGATSAAYSNFFGANAGDSATNAYSSNFFGTNAGNGATNAYHSNFFGINAGDGATNAAKSNLFGYRSGYTFTGNNIDSNNIIIGTNISLPNATANGINIGGILFGKNTYSTTSGDPSIAAASTGKIGIGVVSPDSTLHVVGGLKFVNGTQGAGKVLTSDANGGAAWKYDTVTLATFSAGARLQADTALFTDSTLYGSFYNDGSDTLIITKMWAVMNGGTSDTLGVQVYFNDTINVVGSAVATSTLACNSTTVGNSTTTFTNYKIPPGNWVWMKTPTVVAGRKPYYLSVSLIGYKKRI